MNSHNKRLTRWLAAAVVATAAFLTPQSAQAAGTVAGTTVSNTATVNFNVGSVPQTAVSASVDFVVDNRVNVTVTATGGPSVIPGSTDQVLSFTVQNDGNKTQGYGLSAVFGSGITMNNVRIYIDNGTLGSFDVADVLYTPGTNAGDLAPDANMRILIVADTPSTAVDGNTSTYSLLATTLNAGTTTVTAEYTGADNANTEEVVFADASGPADVHAPTAQDGRHSASSTYTVSTAALTVTKTSAVISDPANGTTNPKRIPGATVRYTITVTNNGAANASNVVITDPIPANTTYAGSSLTLNTASLTDVVDLDAGSVGAGGVTVNAGTLNSGGSTATITFDVTIN
jgi:uncharacterized repeat protein (TIGR01451 family)